MKFKNGVDPRFLSAPAFYGAWIADEVHKDLTDGVEAIITSTGDSKHSVDRSRHYTGAYHFGYCDAFDLRIWHVDAREFAIQLEAGLGKDYVVIQESNHIHCHWAPVHEARQAVPELPRQT